MNKTALITGIAGQDGSYLAELLLSKGYEVHGVEKKIEAKEGFWRIQHILDKLIIHEGDVSEQEVAKKLVAEIKPDEVYHLAAKHDLPNSLENYLAINATNLNSTYFFLSAITGFSLATKLFFASSSRIFGDSPTSIQDEETVASPNSLYGISKLAASSLIKMYREKEKIFACIGILYNHESPRRDIEFLSRKVTLGLARIKLGIENELRLGNLNIRRDWGYAKDYVDGMWRMLQQEKPDDYILATNETHTVREFVEEAGKTLGFDILWKGRDAGEEGVDGKTGKTIIKVDPMHFRPTEANILEGNSSRAREKLGWIPKTSFKELVALMANADFERESENSKR